MIVLGSVTEHSANLLASFRIPPLFEEALSKKSFMMQDLSDSFESKFTGHFKLVCQVLVWEKREIDPRMVRKAVKGLGTDEAALIEVLCTKDNEEIKQMKENYKTSKILP